MKLIRFTLVLTLIALVFVLASCSDDWGEEVVYVQLTNGSVTMDWIVTADGVLMKPVCDFRFQCSIIISVNAGMFEKFSGSDF